MRVAPQHLRMVPASSAVVPAAAPPPRAARPASVANRPSAVAPDVGGSPARAAARCCAAAVSGSTSVVEGRTLGADEYTWLQDRRDLPPLPMPSITAPKRVVLVRHGQSTWNAEGRIQGSSDFAVLTPKGQAQAETTRVMLQDENFGALFHSPLARASETARIVWGARGGFGAVLPSLREIDLYSFQGLLKEEGKARYGDRFTDWQRRAAEFEIDGHAPVRELWYRASLAWQDLLAAPAASVLVVAHNAVNQALVATALGLPPAYFRRLLQSNAAVTVLDLMPGVGSDAPPRVTVDRLNQSPGRPFSVDGAGRAARGRVVLVRHCATASTESGVLLGLRDEPLSTLGQVQAIKTAELLMDMRVDTLLCSPLGRATATAEHVAKLQPLAGYPEPATQIMLQLAAPQLGSWEGLSMKELRGAGLPPDAESIERLWERTKEAWDAAVAAATGSGAGDGAGRDVVVVSHALVHAALLCHCLGLPASALPLWRSEPGGVTVIDFPDGAASGGSARCINYTAHMGRWAVPVTRDDLDLVCGIDGCF